MYFDAAANYHIYQLLSITREKISDVIYQFVIQKINVCGALIGKGVSEMLRVILTSYGEDRQVGISQTSLLGPLFYHYFLYLVNDFTNNLILNVYNNTTLFSVINDLIARIKINKDQLKISRFACGKLA